MGGAHIHTCVHGYIHDKHIHAPAENKRALSPQLPLVESHESNEKTQTETNELNPEVSNMVEPLIIFD